MFCPALTFAIELLSLAGLHKTVLCVCVYVSVRIGGGVGELHGAFLGFGRC